eukprot:TRINITY_DN1178_c0_g1_i1.p1 TRINITY_DN1178_c0_g1~~TRINITY_DN1178_c0_g1_i1.p1  ORF type:complete len:745 (+),score=224.53 TRINITY_DN1178_c0_g1_i1:207-2441(+)
MLRAFSQGRNYLNTNAKNVSSNSFQLKHARNMQNISKRKEEFSIASFFNDSIIKIKERGWSHFPGPKGGKPKEKEKEKEKDKRSDEDDDDLDWEKFVPNSLRKQPGRPNPLWLLLFPVALAVYFLSSSGSKKVSFEEFEKEYLSTGKVKKLLIVGESLVYVYEINEKGQQSEACHFYIGGIVNFIKKLEGAQKDFGISSANFVPVEYQETSLSETLFSIAPILLSAAGLALFAVWSFRKVSMGGGKGLFSFGKSTAKTFTKHDKIGTKFSDVAGLPEAKTEIKEFVDFLKNPKKYTDLGARIPKGAILSGPPGTGKTLLAKATAGEASVPFFSTSGSDFMELFVGVGPARVRDLFSQARKKAPCIVFIDEIDAIGRERGGGSHGNEERDNTLNQILVEMDGFDQMTNVVVLAGTNRVDVLDKALLRPGRFDRHIEIDLPDIKSRKEIYEVHLQKLTMHKEMMPEFASRLAALTPGFSGADIANSCNEAALIAVRREGNEVIFSDFEEAIDRIVGGVEKKNKVLSPVEKTKVAYHEAGHAILGWFLEHTDPLLKVSIVPRGKGLGYAQYLPKDRYLQSEDQLNDKMVMAMGGRAAEEIVFGSISTGATDDIDKVSRIAYSQVAIYGFNDKIGPLSFQKKNDELKLFSEFTAGIIDEEVRNLVHKAYERSKGMLTSKKEELIKLADLLLEKEVLGPADLVTILGERPFQQGKDAAEEYYKAIETGKKTEKTDEPPSASDVPSSHPI